MTIEFDFLLASVRRFFHPESPQPSSEGINWNLVLELADRHAVVGFLRATCDAQLLADGGLEAARSTLALSAELLKLAEVFEKDGIEVMPLKGPTLGAALYQDRVLKVSSDLDLLVRRCDALRAKSLLERIGYRLASVPHWPSGAAYLRNINNELSFNDPGQWLKLDLHWSLLPGYFPCPFDETKLWARMRLVRWGNMHLETLSPEDQLMFLCAHGAKHLWARLAWLCDLARLIQVEPTIDWAKVFEQTRRSHTTRIVMLGLVLADNLLGVQISPEAASLASGDPKVRKLAAIVLRRLRANRTASVVATTAFCVRALERTSDRSRLVFGMFLQPTEAEYRLAQIPPSLYWTYYLFRPLRLAAKYTWRLSGW